MNHAPNVTADDLRNITAWMNCDQTAEWHRRVGKTLRELQWYDEALSYFEKTLELDPTMWRAKSGVAIVFQYQGKYAESIDSTEAALKMIESNEKVDVGNVNNGQCELPIRMQLLTSIIE